MLTDFYVYMHKRQSDGVPFYIGKGSKSRAWKKHGRSELWKRIVKKHGYDVVLIDEKLSEKESFELETFAIDFLGKQSNNKGPLINITDGGEGASGRIVSELTRKKISDGNVGNKNSLGRIYSEEIRKKMSLARIGKKPTNETRKKLSDAKQGQKHNRFGILHTDETKAKMSFAHSGKSLSNETKDKIRKAKSKKVICKELNMQFESAYVASDWLKNNGYPKAAPQNISSACRGKYKIAYGYSWEFGDLTC